MATVNLSAKGLNGNAWIKWAAGAVLVGIIGLGVKGIWFDQKRYLVPVGVIPQGASLALEQWRVVPANLGAVAGSYLAADSKPRGYALDTLYPGRLVQRQQVGGFAPQTMARVVVTNKTQLGSGIRPGATVEIWSAQRLANNQFDAPKRLVSRAQVARIIKGSAMFANQNQQVEVLIQPQQTAPLLSALASDSAVFLVAQQ